MATIVRVEVQAVDPCVRVHWTEERAGHNAFTTTIARITDSDGLVGLAGFDSTLPGAGDLSVVEAVRSLAPAVVGRDIGCREAFADELRIGVAFPFSVAALSLLDVALWDLAAKHAEMPLYRLLGAAREEIPAYASLETMAHPNDYLRIVAEAREEGLRAVKVHAWGQPERDAALLEELRHVHPDLDLMHDAEGVYDFDGALLVARRLEAAGCRWFEAPLPDFDLAGYRELRHRVGVPILPAGYAMWDLLQFTEALRDPPWSALRSEVGSTVGITNLAKLMVLAQTFNMNLEPVSYGHTLSQAAGLHVMLAFKNASYFELPYPKEPWEYGVVNPIRPDKNGMVRAPEADGLGIELDWEWVEAHMVGRSTVEDPERSAPATQSGQ